jgi:hypothetical protein
MEFFGFLMALTLWGWVAVFLIVTILTVLVESEKGTVATFVTAFMIAGLIYFTHFNLYSALLYHPVTWGEWLGGWFLIGAVWGMIKWSLDVHKALGKYKDAKARFLEEKKVAVLTPALAVELSERLDRSYGYDYSGLKISPIPPKAREHKADIIRWMTYWPFSMIGFLLRDFVRRIWNHIYNWLVQTYDRIAKYIYRDVAGDAALMEQGRNEKPDNVSPIDRE